MTEKNPFEKFWKKRAVLLSELVQDGVDSRAINRIRENDQEFFSLCEKQEDKVYRKLLKEHYKDGKFTGQIAFYETQGKMIVFRLVRGSAENNNKEKILIQ